MITLETARLLKAAGLDWQPVTNDLFAIPERDLDDQVFVVSEVLATVEVSQGRRVIAFQGASEWALDDLVLEEVVWLPSEEQLRRVLEAALLAGGRLNLRLFSGIEGCTCRIEWSGATLEFRARDAAEAYAAALLHILEEEAHAG